MQNIESILAEFGISIPEDKKEDFRVKFHENYKTVADYRRVETDRDKWKEKSELSDETISKFSDIDPDKIKEELDGWKKRAEKAEKDAEDKIKERDFDDALKDELSSVRFSSEAAKRAVVSEIKSAGLKHKDGKILGLSDFLDSIKSKDSGAFVDTRAEQMEQSKARFTAPNSNANNPGSMTKDQILKIKDASERQSAIANNLNLFEN